MKIKKKKIGLLIPQMNRGGAERVASILTRLLSDEFEVYLIVFQSNKMVYSVSVDIIDMQLPSQKGLFSAGITFVKRCHKMTCILHDYELDVVISFLNSANLVNAFSKKGTSKKIISIRSYEFDVKKSPDVKSRLFNIWYSTLEGVMFRRIDRVVVVSKLIQQKLVQKFTRMSDKVHTIYNPFDINLIEIMGEEEIPEWLDYFSKDDFVFVSVGRLENPKGWWHLIKSFAYVAKQNKYSKLLIVGDGTYKRKISDEIQKRNLLGRVVLVGDQDNPFKYVKKSNAYVLSSIREGFPNALVEAMACGIPVISNDCLSGAREILSNKIDYERSLSGVEQEKFGILTPRLQLEENWENVNLEPEELRLAEAMLKMVQDSQLVKFYSFQAKKRAEDFNCDACRDKYSNLIKELVDEK